MHVVTLTIDHTKVAGDLTDYVVAVINNSDAGWAALYAAVTEGGGDIRVFKSDDTTELAREIVTFSASGETGEIHIKYSGTLSSTVDTDIHIYADGSSADYAVTATYGRNAVWSAYAAVWHLDGLTDSTGNGNNLTNSNGVTFAAGKLGNAAQFVRASSQKLYVPSASKVNLSMSTNDFTVQYQMYARDHSTYQGVICEDSSANRGWQNYKDGATNGVWIPSTDCRGTLNGLPTLNTWSLEHIVIDPGTSVNYYRNGAFFSNKTSSVPSDASGSGVDLTIGDVPGYTVFLWADMDEVRIIRSLLSANQITTEQNNQNSPSTFYSVAAATSPNVTVTPSAQSITASIPAYSVRKGVTQAPSAQVITASLPTRTIQIGHVSNPSTQVATFSIPTYVIDAGGNITVAVSPQTLTASLPARSILLDNVIGVNAQVATFSTPAPSITQGAGATITPAAQVATLSIPSYTVTTQFGVIVSVVAQVLTFSIPSLLKVGGVWTKRARQTTADWSRRSVNDD